MEFNHSLVSLDKIRIDDSCFRISTGPVSATLSTSIEQFGLLNPPILIGRPKGYRIVSGFKRIVACKQAGMGEIAARLLDPATTHADCVMVAIVDNSSQRPLNLVEQAHAIALLGTVHPGFVQLTEAAKLVGLPINPDMAGKLKKLAAMAPLLKSGVLDGSIALPVAIQLHELDDRPAARALGTLLKELGLSLNRQRELLEWIVSVCRRDDLMPSQLVEADVIANVRQNNDLDRRQKAQRIRDYLKKRRYPNILAFERRFAEIVRRLGLSKGTSLIPPPHFESPSFWLKFEFRNVQELSVKIKEMENIAKSETLAELWNDPKD